MNIFIPPHDTDAEKSVLGSMMLDQPALAECLSILSEDSFYTPKHQKIFRIIKSLSAEGLPADQMSVASRLRDEQEIEMVGGSLYISELTDGIPSTANAGYYATIVSDKYVLRTVISSLDDIIKVSYNGAVAPSALLAKINDVSSALISDKSSGYVKLESVADDAVATITERFDNPGAYPGMPTGIYEVDNVLGGLKGGDEIIVAANPSIGKTAFAMQIGRNVAFDGNPVGIISLEMAKKQLYLRTLFSEASVPGDLLNSGTMKTEQYSRLLTAATMVNKLPIYIDDSTDATASQIIAKAQHLVNSKGVKLLIVDYLQLMDEPGHSNRNLEIGKITRQIKQLAKKADIPIIVLSQLTKDAFGRRPVLKDLRDSGAIAQDADIIIFLWRPEQHNIDVMYDGSSSEGVALIDIAKHRNGPTADFKMRWVKEYTRFEPLFLPNAPYEEIQ